MEWEPSTADHAGPEGSWHLNRIGLFWFVLLGSLTLDQGLKAWTRGRLVENQSLDLPWPGVFELKHVTNDGIAFGMFPGMAIMLTPIAVGIALFAIYYIHKHRRESVWMHLAMAFLAAGAVGNLYDRVFKGGVTDMFWFRAINFPVFNLADVWITFATILLILRWSTEAVRPKPMINAVGPYAVPEHRTPNIEHLTPSTEHPTPQHPNTATPNTPPDATPSAQIESEEYEQPKDDAATADR